MKNIRDDIRTGVLGLELVMEQDIKDVCKGPYDSFGFLSIFSMMKMDIMYSVNLKPFYDMRNRIEMILKGF